MQKSLFTISLLFIGYFTSAQVTNGLIAKYSFNNGNANDEVGSNNGSVINAVLTSDRFGNSNKAYYFNGNSKIDFGDPAEFQFQSSYSISVWFEAYVMPQWGPIVHKRNTTNFKQMFIGTINDFSFGGVSDSLRYFHNASGGSIGAAVLTNPSAIVSGNWHHVVISVDCGVSPTNTVSFYFDGQLVSYITDSFIPDPITGAPLLIGNNNGNEYFTGKIDDLEFFDRPLSASEVSQLFNAADPIAGIDEMEEVVMNIVPNPNSGNFKLISKTPIKSIEITDLSGKAIDFTLYQNEIQLLNNLDGFYFIKTIFENDTFSLQKFIIK